MIGTRRGSRHCGRKPRQRLPFKHAGRPKSKKQETKLRKGGPQKGQCTSLSLKLGFLYLQSPSQPFDNALERYHAAYEQRLHQCRKWVEARYAEHRFDSGVRKELLDYFGKRKFGDCPSAKCLSKHAGQALDLSEHDLGTDLMWAKGIAWMFGDSGPYFEKIVENAMKDYEVCGPGYVGEEDLESWVGDPESWEPQAGKSTGKKVRFAMDLDT